MGLDFTNATCNHDQESGPTAENETLHRALPPVPPRLIALYWLQRPERRCKAGSA